MFTGIIEDIGILTVFETNPTGAQLRVETRLTSIAVGDSVALDGVCLTATAVSAKGFTADVSRETLSRTTLGQARTGTQLNIERALAATGRWGGHIVQGHVDATGRITSLKPDGDCVIFRVTCPKRLMRYIVEKGFVAVDGMSLTVVKVGASSFTLSVIPYTLSNTNLQSQAKGARVNLEVDIVAKYVESLIAR